MSDNQTTIQGATRVFSGQANLVQLTSPKAITSSEKQETYFSAGLTEFPKYIPTPVPAAEPSSFKTLELFIGLLVALLPLLAVTIIAVLCGRKPEPVLPPDSLRLFSHIAIHSRLGTQKVAQLLGRYDHEAYSLIYEIGSVDLAMLTHFPNLRELIVVKPTNMPTGMFNEIVRVLSTIMHTSVLV